MVALHEAFAAVVAQVRALAAQRLGEQEARYAGKRERGGMELVKLHVGQLGAGLRSQRDAVAGGHGGVGGVGVDLSRAARGDQDGPGADAMWLAVLVGAGTGQTRADQVRADDAAIGYHQAGDHGPLGKANAPMCAGKSNQRAADLRACGVPVGVQNAGQRVSALAGAEKLAAVLRRGTVECRAPFNQVGHALRPLGHKHLGSGAINDSIAGTYGVFQVKRHILLALHGHGNSTLRIMGVRLGQRLLGDHQDLAVMSQFHGRTKAGNPRAHHQKIHLQRQFHNL